MKEWMNPEVCELDITATANGQAPSDNYDGEWIEINGKWYLPGNGDTLS